MFIDLLVFKVFPFAVFLFLHIAYMLFKRHYSWKHKLILWVFCQFSLTFWNDVLSPTAISKNILSDSSALSLKWLHPSSYHRHIGGLGTLCQLCPYLHCWLASLHSVPYFFFLYMASSPPFVKGGGKGLLQNRQKPVYKITNRELVGIGCQWLPVVPIIYQ